MPSCSIACNLLLWTASASAFVATHSKILPVHIRGGATDERQPSMLAASPPFAILVEVEVKPDRMDDFLAAMAVDVAGSRQEDGCLRFDLLRDNSNLHRFFFYEVYTDAAAVDVHKATPHFKAWADFKESGGIVSQNSSKCEALDFTG
jgi:autoinducer 2-degrading protein